MLAQLVLSFRVLGQAQLSGQVQPVQPRAVAGVGQERQVLLMLEQHAVRDRLPTRPFRVGLDMPDEAAQGQVGRLVAGGARMACRGGEQRGEVPGSHLLAGMPGGEHGQGLVRGAGAAPHARQQRLRAAVPGEARVQDHQRAGQRGVGEHQLGQLARGHRLGVTIPGVAHPQPMQVTGQVSVPGVVQHDDVLGGSGQAELAQLLAEPIGRRVQPQTRGRLVPEHPDQ
jgi:hypothetical protein